MHAVCSSMSGLWLCRLCKLEGGRRTCIYLNMNNSYVVEGWQVLNKKVLDYATGEEGGREG